MNLTVEFAFPIQPTNHYIVSVNKAELSSLISYNIANIQFFLEPITSHYANW